MGSNPWTVGGLLEAFRSGEVAPEEVYRRCVGRVEAREDMNAFIAAPHDKEIDSTGLVGGQAARGPQNIGGVEIDSTGLVGGRAVRGPQNIAGVPVAIKDNICTSDMPTTAGSALLEGFRPVEDAEVVRRLRRAGAVVFGKTNLDEFGMGNSTETSHFGPTRHPLDAARVPGGSSGGSAAAVAARMCPAALGSDTGGSVRQPASYCGVVGCKPTWGRVSRRGLIAFASSLDTVGWFTHTVDSAALLFAVLAGPDPGDATSVGEPVPAVDEQSCPAAQFEDLRVGVPREWIEAAQLAPAVSRGFDEWRRRIAEAGAAVEEVEIPRARWAAPTYQVIATAEASSNLARYDGVRYGHRAEADSFDEVYTQSRTEGFGREVKRRILLGAYTLSEGHFDAYFERACKVRRLLIDDFRRAFEDVDVIITPTTPATAFRLGERGDDPLDAYADDHFTAPVSLAGLPAMSLPAGRDGDGLPFGLQLAAPALEEAALFSAGRAVEGLGGGAP